MNATVLKISALVLSIAIAVVRLGGERGELFKDGAHIYVGILFGMAIRDKSPSRRAWLWLAIALCVVEVWSSRKLILSALGK